MLRVLAATALAVAVLSAANEPPPNALVVKSHEAAEQWAPDHNVSLLELRTVTEALPAHQARNYISARNVAVGSIRSDFLILGRHQEELDKERAKGDPDADRIEAIQQLMDTMAEQIQKDRERLAAIDQRYRDATP